MHKFPSAVELDQSQRSAPALDFARYPKHDYGNIVVASPIMKYPARLSRRPNLVDYAAVRADFDWADARKLLDGLPAAAG